MKFTRLRYLTILLLFTCSFLLAIAIPVIANQTKPTIDIVQQARTLYNSGDFQSAIPLLQKAAAEFASVDDPLDEAMALSDLAATWGQLAKWEQTEQNTNSSLSLLKSLHQTAEQQIILAQTLDIQRQLALERGKFPAALDIGKQVINIYQQLHLRDGIIQSQINQSIALQELGLYPRACTILLTAALEINTSKCEISENVGQQLVKQSADIPKIRAINALGHVLLILGQLPESKQVLLSSLQMAQEMNLPEEQASIYLNMGNTEQAFANQLTLPTTQKIEFINAALEAYTHAAQLARKHNTQIQANLNRLFLLVIQKNWDSATTLGRSLVEQVYQFPANRMGIWARINLTQSLIKLAPHLNDTTSSPSFAEIDQILNQAYQQADLLGDPRLLAYILLTQAKLSTLQEQWTRSEKLTTRALNLTPTYQNPDIAYQLFWQMGSLRQTQGDIEGAIAQYTQAVNILNSLRGDLVTVNPNVQFSFRESVEPIYRQLVGLLLQEENPSQAKLQQARQTIESLQLAELDNFFRDACAEAKPQLIDNVDPTAAVIYPIILSDRLDVIISIPGQPLSKYTTYKPQIELEKVFHQAQRSLRRTALRRQQIEVASQIYNWLIRPQELDLVKYGIKTLVFILDGYLRNIPTASLYDGKEYLIQKYNIALTPGLQLISPRPLKQIKLKVLLAGLTKARQGFAALPGVAQEIEQISAKVPTQKLVNESFVTRNLEKQLKTVSSPIVHLATHGQFSSNAEKTFILTWNDRINVKEFDQLLRSRSQESKLPIELLVLSACETATGDDRAALGLAGIAIRSGSRSTIGTLWRVNDESTAIFFSEFYQQLTQANVNKAEALRNAQLALMKNPKFKHPYFWSPFVLVGNWE